MLKTNDLLISRMMVFSAEVTDLKIIHSVLRAITFKEYVVVRPMQEGLKFTLEEMRNVETSVYIPRNVFLHYEVTDEDVVFKISLKVFVDCINIFGDDSNASLKLSYRGLSSPLCLVLQHSEDNVTVDCEIKTMNSDDSPDVSLAEECNLCRVVISASVFSELLHRLDVSADEIEISITPDSPYFTLSTTGIAGQSKVSVPKHADAITVFECKQKCVSKYCFSNLRQILKVMNYADKVSVSTGESGLLGLQLVIIHEEKQIYVEYYVTAQYFDE